SFDTIDNSPVGVIEAIGANTHVDLHQATIVGGTLETSGSNAVMETTSVATLDGTQAGNPISIEGDVAAFGGVIDLMGTIINAGNIELNQSRSQRRKRSFSWLNAR